MSEDNLPILIAGAGPAGLALALSLARRGVAFRIVDPKAGPVEQSRAMGVQARTLELYDQLGIGARAVALGIRAERVHLRSGGRIVASLSLGEMGHGVSPHPYLLCLAQDVHERFLIDELERLGVAIEWNRRLEGFDQDGSGVSATLAPADDRAEGRDGRCDGTGATVRADYLVGCDGAHSAVRHGLGLAFEGGTNEGVFFVADVDAEGTDGDLHGAVDEAGVVLLFPVRTSGARRIIGIVPAPLREREDLAWEDVATVPERAFGTRVRRVNWFSRYRVSHRVAERFRVGRAFLAGDAGHIHSPVGGQGMNTGIGDALNLAWKLAAVVGGRAGASILESYEPERIAFARRLVSSTDRAFGPMVSDGALARAVRGHVVPRLARALPHLPRLPERLFRTISQTRIAYRGSPLAEGRAGGVNGGDRLPWIGQADNFAPLASLEWQLHVHGRAAPALARAAASLGLALHVFEWTADAERVGWAPDAACLVRPDGYVGLADARPETLARYVEVHALRF